MFPYKIENLEESLNKKLMASFQGERNGFCQIGDKKWILPAAYKEHALQYYQFKPRNDDIWIVTYPRSGTTLCQEMVWLINNELNFDEAASIALEKRFPFFEFNILHCLQLHEEVIALNDNREEVIEQLKFWRQPGYEWLSNIKSPRHIKTHFPLSLLPPNILDVSKVIYVARNPKDVAVSYFHHNKLLKVHDYVGNFEEYWDYFEKDLLVYSPYWDHLKEGWAAKNNKNLLFLFYENLINDLSGSIKKVASFLNKNVNEEQLDRLIRHLHIDNFRKTVTIHDGVDMVGMANSTGQGFIRKGKIGENLEFTPELLSRADKWIAANLTETNISFPSIPK